MDQQIQSHRLLAWLSFSFGVSLLMSPQVKSFALMAGVAPTWVWGCMFVVVSLSMLLTLRLEDNLHIMAALMTLNFWLWACALATYLYEAINIRTIYPTQALAIVCAVHSFIYSIELWRADR